MIKLNINNNGSIEMSQENKNGKINVDVLDDKGNVDYYYEIPAADMVTLLNYYQYKTDRGEELF